MSRDRELIGIYKVKHSGHGLELNIKNNCVVRVLINDFISLDTCPWIHSKECIVDLCPYRDIPLENFVLLNIIAGLACGKQTHCSMPRCHYAFHVSIQHQKGVFTLDDQRRHTG